MPPKRSSLSRSTSAARRNKRIRASLTNEERQARNEADRLRIANSRALETEGQHAARIERERLRAARSRASETEEQHAARIEKERLRAARSRASETEEQHAARIERERLRAARSRASETEEQHAARIERERLRDARSRASETKEQHAARSERERSRVTRSRRTVHVDLNLVKKLPVVNTDECSWKTNEDLQSPSTVFVKTEWECEIEEGFQENEVTQDETEDELEPPTTVFLKTETMCDIEEALPEENNEESWDEKAFHGKVASQDAEEDFHASTSGSEFLASMRQKIAGALSVRCGDHQESRELLENF
ncbi:hypothetical protein R5R35_011031 [Gryllus longicercus]|uniref:Uncharacterized protein n=1 Tax=Gryllus longicercus TaxID=2509291 RepID=A0AAN9V9V7_9ORTH